MTSFHVCCHKTEGSDPSLQGGGRFRQQKTGKLTGWWLETQLKAAYGELENTHGRAWVALAEERRRVRDGVRGNNEE